MKLLCDITMATNDDKKRNIARALHNGVNLFMKLQLNFHILLIWQDFDEIIFQIHLLSFDQEDYKGALKFDNLQYNSMGRWVNRMIVSPFDGPMFILIDLE